MESTNKFSIVHATVTYPDGREENIEYWAIDECSSTIRVFEYSDDIWSAIATTDGNVYLDPVRIAESRTTYSTHNIEKIEANWAEELVAVADVSVEEQTNASIFGLSSDTDYVLPEDHELDVEIYMLDEWETEDR